MAKVAIITGASSGFGKQLSIRLVDRGYNVVISDMNDKAGKELESLLNKKRPNSAYYMHCDVTKKPDQEALIKLAVQKYGKLDAMVNNAGIGENIDFTKNVTDNWIKVMDIDLTAVILGTRLAIDQFRKQKTGGVVVSTASLAGLYPVPQQPVYAAAKAGVVNFTKSFAHFKKENIRVNCVCPGFVKTGITSGNAQEIMGIKEWIPIEKVIDAFVLGIEDESLGGDVIRITTQYGIDLPFNKKYKSRL
ncbi:hypothetical protein HDV06_006793 [Boothiomyces sp. JEL0866]|nr:hypothetical protein HDV06_006793 [Boothiomyces sp. JEL0866]